MGIILSPIMGRSISSMTEFKHKATLSDGSQLTQEQYVELMLYGRLELEDRTLTLEQPAGYHCGLDELLKPLK
jgi:hypothetical protein